MVMQKAIKLLTDFISVQLSKNKISELFWTVIKLSKTASSFHHYTCFLKNLRGANWDKLSNLIGKYENPIILKGNLLKEQWYQLTQNSIFWR